MIGLMLDIAPAVRKMGRWQKDVELALGLGMSRGGNVMAAVLRDDQLSGRHGDDTGLNIKTGRLHDSIKAETEAAGVTFTSTVYNRAATYWYWHQIGTDRLPKRLFFEEDFAESGPEIYETEIDLALAGVA